MVVFHELCRTAWSSTANKTESVSVMGHARSAAATEFHEFQCLGARHAFHSFVHSSSLFVKRMDNKA